MNVSRIIKRHVSEHPDKIAIIFEDRRITYLELDSLIDEVIASVGATSPADMGKVMGALKAKAAGQADMGAASARVKARLQSS